MLQRGVVVSYETIRQWCAKSGQVDANRLRRRRARPGDKWHLDEVVIADQRHDPLPVARGRPARQSARRPGAVTPKHVGRQEVLPPTAHGTAARAAGARHRQARQLRAGPPRGDALGGTPAIEVSEQPGRELASTGPATRAGDERFTSPPHAQRFLSAFSGISPHFRPRRHLLSATGWRHEMAERFTVWNQITGVTTTAA